MIALTHVSRKAYAALLEDGKKTVCEIYDKYGAGWVFRLQGVLCAMAVRQCATDAYDDGIVFHTAIGLYEMVSEFEYGTIFEDNGLEEYKPNPIILESMLYSMCQAETGNYETGEEA